MGMNNTKCLKCGGEFPKYQFLEHAMGHELEDGEKNEVCNNYQTK